MDRETGIERFDGNLYGDWKFRVFQVLREKNVIGLVEASPSEETRAKPGYSTAETTAQGIIIRHVAPCCLGYIREKKTAFAMIEALDKVFMFSGLSSRSLIRKKIQSMKYDSADALQPFLSQMDSLIRDYRAAGGVINDDEALQYLLESMPESLHDVVTTIMVQSRTVATVTYESAKCVLTEFDAQKKSKSFATSSAEDAAYNAKKTDQPGKKKGNPPKIRCFNCNQLGHKSFQCTKPKKPRKPKSDETDWAVLGASALNSADVCGDKLIFILDSGATDHFVSDASLVQDIKDVPNPFDIELAKKGEFLRVTKCGKIPVTTMVNEGEVKLTLTDACIAPGLTHNLFSVRRITANDGEVLFCNEMAYVKMHGKTIATAKKIGKLYYMFFRLRSASATAATASCNENQLWHRRLGHLNMAAVRKLINGNLAKGVRTHISDSQTFCEPCVLGKSTRLPFKSTRPPTTRPLERVHSDVGQIEQQSLEGHRYYVTFVDDYTHFTITYPMREKSEVFRHFQTYHKMATAHFGKELACLRSDSGGEYTSNAFKEYLRQHGIRSELNVPHNPELNGVAERINRTLIEKARTLMIESKLPKKLWTEALMTAMYLTNRSPTTALKDVTPYELWHGLKPDISNLKIFGSRAYAHIPKSNRQKLDQTSSPMIMVGYVTNGYRLYDPESDKIVSARNVTFDEKVPLVSGIVDPARPSPGNMSGNSDILAETLQSISRTTSQLSDQSQSNDEMSITPATPGAASTPIPPLDVPMTSPTPAPQQSILQPPRLIVPQRNRQPPAHFKDYYDWDDVMIDEHDAAALSAMSTLDDVPQSYDEIASFKNSAEWRKAVQEEINSLNENQTWNIVSEPDKARLLDTKWVFKLKDEVDGSKRYKARLVARGYRQKEGYDYTETYSPVARLSTIRTVLAVGLQKKYYFKHLDVKTAFLNGLLEETIFLKCPQGIVIPAGHVLPLRKSLYGLKQVSKQWNLRFNQYVKSTSGSIGIQRGGVLMDEPITADQREWRQVIADRKVP